MTVCTKTKQGIAMRLKYDREGNLERKDAISRQIGTTVTLENIFKCMPGTAIQLLLSFLNL
jgi:DNA mismatch repair ATPase MutL